MHGQSAKTNLTYVFLRCILLFCNAVAYTLKFIDLNNTKKITLGNNNSEVIFYGKKGNEQN